MQSETIDADAVARTVIARYRVLPTKGKPTIRSNGVQEWTILAGTVLSNGCTEECVSLATGIKCLPECKVKDSGGVRIRDMHAEIMALRGLNRFFLEEIERMLDPACNGSSVWIERRNAQKPFSIRPNVSIYLYISTLPCGACSMENVIGRQSDAQPWTIAPSVKRNDGSYDLRGRSYFSELSAVRTKPGRSDSLLALSKSCSDKLAHRSASSILSSVTTPLIDASFAYLKALVVPRDEIVTEALHRAFVERLARLSSFGWPLEYRFQPIQVIPTDELPPLEVRLKYKGGTAKALAAATTSCLYVLGITPAALRGSVLLGRNERSINGQPSAMISTRSMYCKLHRIATLLGLFLPDSYEEFKNSEQLKDYNQVKQQIRQVLAPWNSNPPTDFTVAET